MDIIRTLLGNGLGHERIKREYYHIFCLEGLYLFGTEQPKGYSPFFVLENFISIFSYGVDFNRDIRKGDKFEIIYKNYIIFFSINQVF